jgi:hypothetical protein
MVHKASFPSVPSEKPESSSFPQTCSLRSSRSRHCRLCYRPAPYFMHSSQSALQKSIVIIIFIAISIVIAIGNRLLESVCPSQKENQSRTIWRSSSSQPISHVLAGLNAGDANYLDFFSCLGDCISARHSFLRFLCCDFETCAPSLFPSSMTTNH